MPLLVDTSILIDLFRGKDWAANWVDQHAHDLMVPAIVIGELYQDVREGEERRDVDEFLAVTPVVALTHDAARVGGLLRRTYGPSHGADFAECLIAATSILSGYPLATLKRKHFPMLPDLSSPPARRRRDSARRRALLAGLDPCATVFTHGTRPTHGHGHTAARSRGAAPPS